MKILGIVLIVLGILMFVFGNVTFTRKEKVVDAGPLQVSVNKQKTINWPPYLGGILLIGGIVIVATAKKRT